MRTLTVATHYDKLTTLRVHQFKRLTGVKRSTFSTMVDILSVADAGCKARGGRASKLCIEDCLLMALEYLREYRIYFHVAEKLRCQ